MCFFGCIKFGGRRGNFVENSSHALLSSHCCGSSILDWKGAQSSDQHRTPGSRWSSEGFCHLSPLFIPIFMDCDPSLPVMTPNFHFVLIQSEVWVKNEISRKYHMMTGTNERLTPNVCSQFDNKVLCWNSLNKGHSGL